MNTQTTPIRHKDVKGKEQLYIKIEANNQEMLINVGNKTFLTLEQLLNPKTPLTDKEIQNKKK